MSRKQKLRKSKEKLIFIFSEWETEICYFNQLKRFLKLPKLYILGNKWQISWKNVDKIFELKKSIYWVIENNRSKYTKKNIKDTGSKIFYLLDIDWFNRNSYTQEEIDFIKNNFEDENIKVFFSNKDFELWILLHLLDYRREDWKYIEKIEKITQKEYKKWNCNIEFFGKIIENNLQDAIDRWRKLEDYQIKSQWRSNLKNMNPFTEVYKIFNELEI